MSEEREVLDQLVDAIAEAIKESQMPQEPTFEVEGQEYNLRQITERINRAVQGVTNYIVSQPLLAQRYTQYAIDGVKDKIAWMEWINRQGQACIDSKNPVHLQGDLTVADLRFLDYTLERKREYLAEMEAAYQRAFPSRSTDHLN